MISLGVPKATLRFADSLGAPELRENCGPQLLFLMGKDRVRSMKAGSRDCTRAELLRPPPQDTLLPALTCVSTQAGCHQGGSPERQHPALLFVGFHSRGVTDDYLLVAHIADLSLQVTDTHDPKPHLKSWSWSSWQARPHPKTIRGVRPPP